MGERIQKIIANTGYCSRRKAEVLIKEGKVEVNNKKIEHRRQRQNKNYKNNHQ